MMARTNPAYPNPITTAPQSGAAAPIIHVASVSHRFRKLAALDNVSLSVRPGEVVGLLGANGSGKSTLISLLSGLAPIQSGTVTLFSHPVTRLPAPAKRDIAVVFQSASLDPKLTPRETLTLAANLYAIHGPDRDARIAEALDAASIASRADAPLAELSGGMRRRLDLARALLPRPRLLLLDEPSAGLDEASFRALWNRLNTLRETTGLTIVVATHRPDEAEQCSRVVVLRAGRIIAEGTPASLLNGIAHDVIVLEPNPAQGETSEAAAARIAETLTPRLTGVTIQLTGSVVIVNCDDGPRTVPRVVDALPQQSFAAIHLRRASLADAFLRLTGYDLAVDETPTDDPPTAQRGEKASRTP